MKLTIKLLPPYIKKGQTDQFVLQLKADSVDLQELARHLSSEWRERFNYALFDDHNQLTAEFMVNGKSASLDTALKDSDQVTILPYIFGG